MSWFFPAMPECNSCGDCCGPVTATATEITAIRGFVEAHGIAWTEHDDPLTCGFYDRAEQKCRIYPVRPAACRMFGVVDEMPWPHFPDAASVSMPIHRAIQLGIMNPEDRLLSESFGGTPGISLEEIQLVGMLTARGRPAHG